MTEPAPLDSTVTQHDVARGAGAALVARLGAVFELISQPLYVWMFGLAGFGVYAVMWSAINLVENVADLGATSALQRVVPQENSRSGQCKALLAAMVIGVLPNLLLAIIGFVGAPWLASYMNVAANDRDMLVGGIRLFVWALPLWAFIEVATSALRAQQVFGAEVRLRIFWEQIIRFAFAFGFWSIGFGVEGLLYGHLASLLATALLSIRLLLRYYDFRADDEAGDETGHWGRRFRLVLFAGLGTLPANITARIYGDAPPVIANLLVPGAGGAAAAAIYTIARKVSSVVQLIRIALSYVVTPLVSKAAGQRDHAAIESIYGFSTRLSVVIALPLTASMMVGGPAILDMFGPGALAGWSLLAILTFARAVEAFAGQASAVQQVISSYHHPLFASLGGMVFAVLVGVVVLPFSAMNAIAAGVAVGMIAAALISMYQVNLHEGLHPFGAPFGRVLRKTLAVTVLVALLSGLSLLAPPFVRLGLLLPIMFGGIWLGLRVALPKEDKMAFGRLSRRLRL